MNDNPTRRFRGIQLAQSRPSGTSAVSAYAIPDSCFTEIMNITVCNTSAADRTFRIFLDNDGTTYDETTALFWDVDILSNRTVLIEWERGLWMNKSGGNLAVRTSSANALTFTVNGVQHET